MECSKIHNDLIFFIEGSLDERRSAEIEQHLASCKECSAFADMLRASLGVIEEERNIPVDQGFADRIIAKVDSRERKQKTRTLSILRYVAAAAVIIFGVFTGMNIARLASAYQDEVPAGIGEEAYYINDMYQEPIESFFLLKYEENE